MRTYTVLGRWFNVMADQCISQQSPLYTSMTNHPPRPLSEEHEDAVSKSAFGTYFQADNYLPIYVEPPISTLVLRVSREGSDSATSKHK